jgi:hypothetical protein
MSQQRLSRRSLMRGAASLAGGAAFAAAAPRFVYGQTAPAAVVPETMRPQLRQGLHGRTEAMTVSLKDLAGATLYKQELTPRRG